MHLSLSAALLGLAATVVSAQDQDLQSGPWHLKIKGTTYNSKLNGYASSCHAGAAISALCYSKSLAGEASDYYFNYTTTSKVEGHNTGYVTWNQPYTGSDNKIHYVNQAMALSYLDNSNVAPAMFGFEGYKYVGWDNNELFGVVYGDDSKNVAGTPPKPASPKSAYSWAVCWQYVGGGYYYQSVAWIQTGKPHNPTCETVEIFRIKAQKS